MNLDQTLTKENFFNEMLEKYPKAMKHFCEWIDQYKKAVNWDSLFNVNCQTAFNVKFHDLPHAMQYGIWIEYCRQELGNYFEQPEHISDFVDLREDIEGVFKETEELVDYEK